jgi:predicted phage-related endonuclease
MSELDHIPSEQVEQRSAQWFLERLGRATGSKFKDVMATTKTGESAYRKKYKIQLVAERLTGVATTFFVNAAMQWGTDHEDEAAEQFSIQTGLLLDEIGFVKHPTLMCGVSPDRVILTPDYPVLEIKCPETATHVEWMLDGVLPEQHKPQVMGQMWLMNCPYAYFCSYDPRMPGNAQLFIVKVERDDVYIEKLKAEIIKFLSEVDEMQNTLTNYSASF